ncbi:MAG: hypothetical protein HOI66_05185, partial [Verrucomicrobia bacterium]|nr:hypothetical protein [Verrucomicrobiota bacterium]
MAKSDDDKGAEKKEEAKRSGGIKEFLPLILTLTIMPVVAFAMTQFVLVPQLQAKLGTGDPHAADGAHDDGHGSAAPAHGSPAKSSHGGGHGEAAGEGGSNMATVKKVLVNVKGTAATRYLVSSFALTGSGGNISTLVEEHDPQLRDIAMG